MQDSPILGDVWIEYARHPDSAIDLLITSDRHATASEVATAVYQGVRDRPLWKDDDPDIAPLQSFVAARLYFDDLLRIVVPMTKWWHDQRTVDQFGEFSTPDYDDASDSDGPRKLNQSIDDVRGLLDRWSSTSGGTLAANQRTAFERFIALCALVSWQGRNSATLNKRSGPPSLPRQARCPPRRRMRSSSRPPRNCATAVKTKSRKPSSTS